MEFCTDLNVYGHAAHCMTNISMMFAKQVVLQIHVPMLATVNRAQWVAYSGGMEGCDCTNTL